MHADGGSQPGAVQSAAALRRVPLLLVVSGPSGSGKDSLVEELRKLIPDLAYSVSVTTRPPRIGEVNGIHYHFVGHEEFRRLAQSDSFIETREYAGNFYGTPKLFLEQMLAAGQDVIMKPEVNGAVAIKNAYSQAVLVFLTAPSAGVLAQRLRQRHSESADAIAQRLEVAKVEEQWIGRYDYLIVNDALDVALAQLRAIVIAERLKVARINSSVTKA